MGTVQLQKDWSNNGITPNLRNAYSSLNDMAAWWIYENTQRLTAKWTRVWESDGTNGPANDGDHTQRLVNKAACTTRGAAAANAQSWGVYQASNGSQLCIAYQGATDDVIRLGYSRLGQYARAGTATHQPTAADELVISAGNSIVGSGTSLDRVMSIWCIDGDWRCAIFRSNAIVNILGLALTSPLVSTRLVNPIFTPPFVAWRYTAALRNSVIGSVVGGIQTTAIGAAGSTGTFARVHTDSLRNIRVGGGEISVTHVTNSATTTANGTSGNTFNTDKPALQNGEGSPLLPIYWSGEKTANCDGFLCSPIDWWACYASAATIPALGDPFSAWDPTDTPGVTTPRSNWLVGIGSALVWPWRNIAANLETA